MSNDFIRIPPDSTGKRIRHGIKNDILLSSSSVNLNNLRIGDLITNDTTSGTALFSGWDRNSDNSITIFISDKVGSWVNTNTISCSLGVIGTISEILEVHSQINTISDPNNPRHIQRVGPEGSSYVRFSEGVPQLDSFGKLRISGAAILGSYTISSDSFGLYFVTRTEKGATSTTNDVEGAQILTTNTTSGSTAILSSITHHTYVPGASYLFLGTLAMDAGKTNLIREWGIFDEDNGFLFRETNNQLSLVIRSSSSGVLSEIEILQNNWNKDRLDGTGLSGMDIDITKDNLYWIDVQWLGAGRVRFGTYFGGERVVIHEYLHGNTSEFSLTQTCNLPIKVTQRNNGVVGTSSTIKTWCLAVWTESNTDIRTLGILDQYSFTYTIPTGGTGNLYYMGMLSPKITQPFSGKINKSIYFPVRIEYLAYDSVTGNDVPVEYYSYVDSVITSPTWQQTRFLGSVEYDVSGTFYGGGKPVIETYVKGQRSIELSQIFDNESLGTIKNYPESGGTVNIPILSITKASPAVVTFNFPYVYNREGNPFTISGVVGMTEINGAVVYPKYVGVNSVELYQDLNLTTPYNTTTFSNYTSGGIATGLYGTRMTFVCAVKKIFDCPNPIKAHMSIVWKEIIQ